MLICPTAFCASESPEKDDAWQYLKSILYSHEEVANWISNKVIIYGEKYDPELGWILADRLYKDGVDQSVVTYRYDPSGARHTIHYSDKPCRINAYGDSFTHCDQVNDSETWEEVLAAHLMEPIRNYGVGGYSVYQSYLRMKREEAKNPAKYIIFNIFDDDHYRNLHGWRNIRLGYRAEASAGLTSPAMPYVKANPHTGAFQEFSNPCPAPDSVYHLCDIDWVYEHFKDALITRIMVAENNLRNGTPQRSFADIINLGREQGFSLNITTPQELRRATELIYTKAGLFASRRIVELVEEFAGLHQKKVLYVLSYGSPAVAKALAEGRRFDESFVNFLNYKGLPYIDLLQAHRIDYAQWKGTPNDYVKRYWIGHYNPLGNFFQAFAIKSQLVAILDPKPLPYLPAGSFNINPETLRFPDRALEIIDSGKRNPTDGN